jgi:hypothetical protein
MQLGSVLIKKYSVFIICLTLKNCAVKPTRLNQNYYTNDSLLHFWWVMPITDIIVSKLWGKEYDLHLIIQPYLDCKGNLDQEAFLFSSLHFPSIYLTEETDISMQSTESWNMKFIILHVNSYW